MKPKWLWLAIAAVALVAIIVGLVVVIYHLPVRGIPPGWLVLNGSADWNWAHGRVNAHCVNGDSILASSEEYGDVTFSAIVGTTNREASLAIRLQDENNGYIVVFAPANTPGNTTGFVRLVKRTSVEGETTLATYQKRKMAVIGLSAKITVVARGPAIQVYLNGERILQAHDATFASGYIGFRVYGWADFPCDATFAGVRFHGRTGGL